MNKIKLSLVCVRGQQVHENPSQHCRFLGLGDLQKWCRINIFISDVIWLYLYKGTLF